MRASEVIVTRTDAFGSTIEPATKRLRVNANAHVAAPPASSKPQPLTWTTAPRRASTATGATEVTSARLNVTRARSAAATVRLGGRKRAGYRDRDASGAIGSGSEQQDDAGSQNSTTTTPPPAPPSGNAGETHVADSPSAAMVAGDSMTASFEDAPRPNRHTARAPAVSLRVVPSPGVGNRSRRSTPPRKPEPCIVTTSPPAEEITAGVTAATEAHANASASLRSQEVARVVDEFRGTSYQSGEYGASDP